MLNQHNAYYCYQQSDGDDQRIREDFPILACSRYFSCAALVVSKAMSSIPGFSRNGTICFTRIAWNSVFGQLREQSQTQTQKNQIRPTPRYPTLGDSFLGGIPVGVQGFTLKVILRNVVVLLFQMIPNDTKAMKFQTPPPCLYCHRLASSNVGGISYLAF